MLKVEKIYIHIHGLNAYNRTTDSANKTCATLMKIIKNFGEDAEDDTQDPLMKILSGDDEDAE